MFRANILMGALLSLGTLCVWAMAQDPLPRSRPLDLPSGGTGDSEEEEDAPEVITFYGVSFEGDGFFWCLDRSISMGWNGAFQTLKSEMAQSLQQLSKGSEFSLVTFAANTQTWSEVPRPATSMNKAAATMWVNNLTLALWTCLEDAGVRTVNIANRSSKKHKKVLILSDGQPWCNGADTSQACLASITAANWQSIPIDCLYISADSAGITFMQQLAGRNKGKFTLVH